MVGSKAEASVPGGWPVVLERLIQGEDLSSSETAAIAHEILSGQTTDAQIAGFLVALRIKGATVEEITGLVETMLQFAEQVPFADPGSLVDTCGTGGDLSHTINISTIAAFVVAGAGVKVCKHGNKAVSSSSGSADVLSELGVNIDLDPKQVAMCIDEAGMGFCYAPRYHKALRNVGKTRIDLGIRTVFNFVGPLANPARVGRQVIGVSDALMADKIAGVLSQRKARHAMVVFGHDGLDELTTTDKSTVIEVQPGDTKTYQVDPKELGFAATTLEDLRGGDPNTNADVAKRVLQGEKGPHRDIILLNAAAALVVADKVDDLAAGVALAGTSVDEGLADGVLQKLIETSNR